jgi:hypothetical protein
MDKTVFYLGSAAMIVVVWVMLEDAVVRWKARRDIRRIHTRAREIARQAGLDPDELESD